MSIAYMRALAYSCQDKQARARVCGSWWIPFVIFIVVNYQLYEVSDTVVSSSQIHLHNIRYLHYIVSYIVQKSAYGQYASYCKLACPYCSRKARSTLATMSKQHCRSNRQLCRSPVHAIKNVRATLSNATSWTILSTMSNVASTLLPFWQQCCRFRQQCRMKFRPFDKVGKNWTCLICFDFVERTTFYNRIVRHCCRLWQQSRMLLRQQCCWCGRGLTRVHTKDCPCRPARSQWTRDPALMIALCSYVATAAGN